MKMLEQSHAKRNFIALISHFTTQINGTYCSIASTAMVFNAGGVPRPGSTENPKGHYFDQVNLIDEVKDKFDVKKVLKSGVTLDTCNLCQSFSRSTNGHSRSGRPVWTRFARRRLPLSGSRVSSSLSTIFDPMSVQAGAGHISLVASSNAENDRFLTLDVTRGKYPPAWVPASRLFSAMQAVDSDSGLSRGFAVIKTS